MKIILSRKGFDSANGGVPSPIFPDGSMLSLPIPAREDAHRMCDLNFEGINLGELAEQLTRGGVPTSKFVHLDPDINEGLVPRPIGWRAALGQSGSAQSHLASQRVEVGDLFLFYGWFRQVQHEHGKYSYARGAPGQHVLFGWLQIGEIWNIGRDRERLLSDRPAQLRHPHLAPLEKYSNKSNNTLYVAADRLNFGTSATRALPGAGGFPGYALQRVLTKDGMSRRHWRLPNWFYANGHSELSYHRNAARWTRFDDHVELQSAAIGQEFVMDLTRHNESVAWLDGLFRSPA